MRRVIRLLVRINVWCSRVFDKVFVYPPESVGSLVPHKPQSLILQASSIADVGGGKKPFIVSHRIVLPPTKSYVGLDIDEKELKAAPPGTYTETLVFDLSSLSCSCEERFDLVLCRYTLEHVIDTEAAFSSLQKMLVLNGYCFLGIPCRSAVFARLNRILPEQLKKILLIAIFPEKKGDGFPAYYDKCTPSLIEKLAEAHGLEKIALQKSYRSKYFTFCFPLYVLVRLIGVLQYIFDQDYCERFDSVWQRKR